MIHGLCEAFLHDSGKNRRCACPNSVGILLKLGERAEQAGLYNSYCLAAHTGPTHLSIIGGVFSIGKCHLVRSTCPLSRIQRLSFIWEQ